VIALDAADLVVIAGAALGIGTDAALAQMDIAAAEQALAEAALPGSGLSGTELSGIGLSAIGPSGLDLSDPAAAAMASISLVSALLRHRPFPRHGQQVAVAAGLQFLSLNGWRADLNPAATAVVVVEALAAGHLPPGDAARWLSSRLSPVRAARQAPVTASRAGNRRSASLLRARRRRGRTVTGAVLAVAVGGGVLLAAACSRAPELPAAPAGVVHVVGTGAPTGAPGPGRP
jgi:hypothetical protein